MRAPAFWQGAAEPLDWRARLLSPLAGLYAAATARRVARAPKHRAAVPVICVGNLNVGGSGKTPTVIALTERLDARGCRPHLVSRGYGGRCRGPLRVDPQRHSPAEVGDEPLLLTAFAPTWVARDRAAGVRAAEAAGAPAIVLDDGFQNPAVARALSLVVVDAETGFGNGRVLPAGPLREPVAAGLTRADLMVLIGGAAAQTRFEATWGPVRQPPVTTAELTPLRTGMDWQNLRVLAFAGIGRPEKFFATLREIGADVVRSQPLDDHQPLGAALIARLEREAQSLSAQLVTTEKDAVRLPDAARSKVLTLPVRLVLNDAALLDEKLIRLGL